MKQIQLSSEMSASELKSFKAEIAASKKNKVRYRMNEGHYNRLMEEEAEVLTPQGKLLGVLLKGRVSVARLEAAYPYLRLVNGSFTNRGSAIGLPMALRQRLDGSIANTQEVNPKELERQNVGLNDYFGFWEGKAQRNNPFPHETSFTRWLKEKHPEGVEPLIRLAQAADQLFKKYAEPYWYAQLELAARIPKYILPGTSFTTCTINKTYTAPDGVVKDVQTSPHLDKGDFASGLGVMLCQFRGADVEGFHLCVPRYRVAFRFRSTDLLLCNVHELHGNTDFVASGPFERLSCVYYLRPKIVAQVTGPVSRAFLGSGLPETLDPTTTGDNEDNKDPSRRGHGDPLTRQTSGPRVWDCHAGQQYPADAAYVGCRVTNRKGGVIREGSIFGNGTNPFVSHKGGYHGEAEFRAYAIDKLRDPPFRAEAGKLCGKDLLCWCVQDGPKRAQFCHARVWLDLINSPEGPLARPELYAEQRREFDWGYYEPNFLSQQEADALFDMAKAQPRFRPTIKRSGYSQRRCASTCWSVRDRNDDAVGMVPLTGAPPEILVLQAKLSALAGKEVNYFSLQAYENERDHIGFHQHREDKCRDARVFIISLGERRSFAVDQLCPDCLLCDGCNQRRCRLKANSCSSRTKCRAAKKHRNVCAVRRSTKTMIQPGHGSLIYLTSEANDWYEHAVVDDKQPKGLRVSINTKCIPPEDAAEGYVPRELRHGGRFAPDSLSSR